MTANRVRLIYFSPTGTTVRVLEGIAQGMAVECVQHVNLTLPGAPVYAGAPASDRAPTIFGAPVYGGRVPPLAARRLRRLLGRCGPGLGFPATAVPAAVVVVYGNRAYEDALLAERREPEVYV